MLPVGRTSSLLSHHFVGALLLKVDTGVICADNFEINIFSFDIGLDEVHAEILRNKQIIFFICCLHWTIKV